MTLNAYPTKMLILGILALGLLSALLAPITDMALLEVSLFFLLFCFSIFIASQKVPYGIIIIGLVIYEVTVIYTHTKAIGFVNPRFLNQYLTWILPLATLPLAFLQNKKTASKIILYLIAIMAWTLAIANPAKGMFISLFIAGLTIFIIFRKEAKTWLLTQIKVISMSAVIAAIGYLITQPHITVNFVSSFTTRLTLWHKALSLILSHPLLGAGPMHFAYYKNSIAAHPHNGLLLIASEWGLPALALVLLLYFRGFLFWIRSAKAKTTPTTLALTASLIAGSSYALVSGILVMPLSQIMMCLVIGWMLGIYHGNIKPKTKPALATELVFILFLIFAIAGLIIGITPTVFYLPSAEVNWLLTHDLQQNLIANPRF